MYQKTFSLYLHFPYCSHRCPYCDFNVHVRKQIPEVAFIDSLILEAKAYASLPEWQSRKISTIFLGGGTPSLFADKSITNLLSELSAVWDFDEKIEISMEANPDNLSLEKLQNLKSAGISRLSIGTQSLNDKFLKILGRNHSNLEAKAAIQNARKAGFENINIDLMFSLPEQTIEDLKQDISAAIELAPDHISYYSLTIESGTPFYERQLSGALRTPSNDLSASMMEEIISSLAANGYSQYEISNFSKDGFPCRHNQAYWQGKDYLGIGPGAHSALSSWEENKRVSTKRWSNRAMPERYLENPSDCVAWSEMVTGSSLVFESILLGLRQTEGIRLDHIVDNLSSDQKLGFWKIVEDLQKEEFLVHFFDQSRIALTAKGLMVADSVTERFAALLNEKP